VWKSNNSVKILYTMVHTCLIFSLRPCNHINLCHIHMYKVNRKKSDYFIFQPKHKIVFCILIKYLKFYNILKWSAEMKCARKITDGLFRKYSTLWQHKCESPIAVLNILHTLVASPLNCDTLPSTSSREGGELGGASQVK
jgi:hypothetical protein